MHEYFSRWRYLLELSPIVWQIFEMASRQKIPRRPTLSRNNPAGSSNSAVSQSLTVRDIMNQFPSRPSTSAPPARTMDSSALPDEPRSLPKAPESSKRIGVTGETYTLGDGYTPFFNVTKRHINAIVAATPPPPSSNVRKDPLRLAIQGVFVASQGPSTLLFSVIYAFLVNLLHGAPSSAQEEERKTVEPTIVIHCTSASYAKILRKKIMECVDLQWGDVAVAVRIHRQSSTPRESRVIQRCREWCRRWRRSRAEHQGAGSLA
ncbi:hypothetical protein F5Y10DRAFT_146986 [Nemania abortiva]|nr:hypothetical protein F5Y10DRAFT_146986 [Nemania abortiva]